MRLESQHSKLFTTVVSLESLKSEIGNHVYDLQREVQQLQQIRVQTHPLTSGTMSIDTKEVLGKAVKGAAQSPEMGVSIHELNGQGTTDQQRSQTTPNSRCYRLNVTPSQTNHKEILEFSDPNGSMSAGPLACKACQRSSQRSKQVVKCAVGGLTTFLGTIKWRIRTVRCNNRASTGLNDERFELETDVTIQPSRWLSARCLRLQLSRAIQGLTCSIKQYSMVPPGSLIFEYCKSSNLSGVRDLLQHGLASPLDTSPDGRTPIHVR